MKHPTSRLLYTYWDGLRRERAAPERGEIEPGAIRNLLADALILSVEVAERRACVRLAGTRVCALFKRDLKGSDFSDLWGDPAADPWRLIDTVAVDTVGIVAGLRGETARDEVVDLELLLLPLRHRGRTQTRILGALSPHVIPSWLGHRALAALRTTSLRVLGPVCATPGPATAADVPTHLPEPANDVVPRRHGHLLVHPGGRS